MRPFRNPKKISLLAVSLLLPVAALVTVIAPDVVRCYLVRWSALDNIAPHVYVDPGSLDRTSLHDDTLRAGVCATVNLAWEILRRNWNMIQ